jgi:hypothetical protein
LGSTVATVCEMAKDPIKTRRNTPEPFDQDSDRPDSARSESGLCRECHARRCENCSNVDCSCAHPFAAVARAIVELDVSVHRTWRVLGQAGVTPKKDA